MKKILIGLMATVLISGIMLSACAPTTTSTPTPTPTPTPEPQVFKWKAQSIYSAGALGYSIEQRAMDDLRRVTGGRLDITMHPIGTYVGWTEMLEAAGEGVYEVGFGVNAFHAGADPGFGVMLASPGIQENALDVSLWMHEFGGLEIFRSAYAEYNVYYTGPRFQPPEPIMSTVPIRTIDDFKGVKIRTPPGLTTDFFTKLGAVPVPLGGGEVYTALQTGVVDAVEFITLSGNYGTGLHEVSDYVIFPSPHTPVGNTGWEINMDAWNSLPDDLKAALEAVAALHTIYYDVKQTVVEKESLDKMIAAGLEHITLSDADWKVTGEIGLEVLTAYRSKSALSAKLIDSKIAFWKKMGKV